ncbi:hypothetical protein BX661DRAFT_180350 [Kickxella alabastrina]|uniref:uncharacterized protein n=1 Tax=Kickxella alabastrina TaxID=61397 RepID=UPI00221EBC10|nr:uncharacterized protein BX661DRAFT_180350 [Kickxella alabastrina]KAI7830942.1 hypothetical protein BX661DRAFT_180350 [Kickxella alabastrina]
MWIHSRAMCVCAALLSGVLLNIQSLAVTATAANKPQLAGVIGHTYSSNIRKYSGILSEFQTSNATQICPDLKRADRNIKYYSHVGLNFIKIEHGNLSKRQPKVVTAASLLNKSNRLVSSTFRDVFRVLVTTNANGFFTISYP